MYKYYKYWNRELAGEKSQSRDTLEPIAGFWRINAAKTKPDYPVAVWYEDDSPVLKIGNKIYRGECDDWHNFKEMTFPKCQAVSEEEYHKAMDTGFWSDGKPAKKMSQEEKLGIDISVGGNNPPVEESISDQINNLAEIAAQIPEPQSQEEANKATEIVDKLRALWKIADAKRKEEKRPFDEGAKEVQRKWTPILNTAKQAGAELDAKRKAFLRKEQERINAELERKRKEAEEKARKLEEEARKKAKEEGKDPETVVVKPEPVEEVRATAGSEFGRVSGLRKVRIGVIVNMDKFINAIKDQPDFIEFLEKKANAAARSKISIDGMEIREELR